MALQSNGPMHIHWAPADRSHWDDFHSQALGGLQQSWAYGQALEQLQVPVLRAAITANPDPRSPWLGAVQFIVHRLPWFVRFAYAQGGPLWAPDTDPTAQITAQTTAQTTALAALRATLPLRRPRVALFSPPQTVQPFSKRPRLLTGGSSVILDLTQDEATRRAAQEAKWRNRLNAAERGPLKIRRCGPKLSDIQWLIDAEAQQRRSRRYFTLPTGFVEAYLATNSAPRHTARHASQGKPTPPAILTLAAELKNHRCAGMMFLLHGRSATYHLGWTDDTGREHSAHNLLLWQACTLLAENGVQQLDLGGVDTEQNPGLARFKLGSGGRVVTGPGTYL